MNKRSPTTKDVGLLHQLHKGGQLTLAAEFQRNAVWPHAAKAYLIDTILNDRPIPLLFFQRTTSAQTGLTTYTVIDGQQRLRAIFDFIEDRFRLTQSSRKEKYFNKRFSGLTSKLQDKIRNYDLVVEELSGYSDDDIRDMFVRINRYVVQLAPQELRHAKGSGKFHEFAERLGKLPFWKTYKIFSPQNIRRMRSIEFSAELAILLIEGPQDKKASIDLYYVKYKNRFPGSGTLFVRLKAYVQWVTSAIPELAKTRFRKAVDLYALIGALDRVTDEGSRLSKLSPAKAGENLREFARQTKRKIPSGEAARYIAAASRQTDNVIPRTTRIEVLEAVLRS